MPALSRELGYIFGISFLLLFFYVTFIIFLMYVAITLSIVGIYIVSNREEITLYLQT